jgi:GNAT superfamily N-acetyltransferase
MLAAYARRLTLEWPVHYTPIMPVLSLASPEEIRAILSETHALWSEGMTREDYMTFVFAQMESPWGRKNFRYLVWKDGDTVLSSLKLYRLDARWGSRRMVLGGIGAVYTPRAHRGQGHARAMLSAVLALMPSEGMTAQCFSRTSGWSITNDSDFTRSPRTSSPCRSRPCQEPNARA